ncbi:ABC transporter ATP-binding protein [Methanocella sp. CWC-04]|uniref:ABC transporter ATP-binding protein n=1 Tax=Methanooceanicella nereidis TaxID=2052831 RepID=A0AAP2W788_9EURY|nr:ATP-binding cassette domain-containing protein [Methanocella sp. CWC-04]MCD1294974.1 ABC transporter ATP-binding protein [Methanocella sp. CWC-04]
MTDVPIAVYGLCKRFRDFVAVDSVSFEIESGIFGLLGPNGAGKSTIVLMLTTLLKPTSGNAFICGYDIKKEPVKVRECISYVPQDLAVDDKLTGRENVTMFARLYGIRDPAKKVNEVLDLLELTDKADMRTNTYSGGMKRRLELAQALVHEPKVLFFDEPTVGLDVASRTRIWSHLRKLAAEGVTIFITTHYMDEADMFCDRVAIIDHGSIKAIDSPSNLKSKLSKPIVTIKVQDTNSFFPDLYYDVEGISLVGSEAGALRFMVDNDQQAIPYLSEIMIKNGIKIASISVQQPTLNEVFLKNIEPVEEMWNKNAGLRFKRMVRRRK